MSLHAVADDVELGRLVRIAIEGGALRRQLTALWRGGPRDLSPVARDLLDVAVVTASDR